MKLQIKSLAVAAMISAAMATGCNSSNKEKEAENAADSRSAEVEDVDIRGQWYIENIVFNDSDYVRPAEVVPGSTQYINFDDSAYYIMTNCNSISGSYSVKGDSITIGDGPMTEMACDNMATEDALRRILPDIRTVDVQNDSVIRLNGVTPAECIMLRKAAVEIK